MIGTGDEMEMGMVYPNPGVEVEVSSGGRGCGWEGDEVVVAVVSGGGGGGVNAISGR